MDYRPPYILTSKLLSLVEEIGELIGRYTALSTQSDLKLRKIRKIQTIQGSLAIEGNTLTEEQILTVVKGKTVIAPPKEIQEVRNAIKVYEAFEDWNPFKEKDLLRAHQVLTKGLLDFPGQYRRKAAGVMGSKGKVIHIAPPAENVPPLMKDLINWLKDSDEHPLISSSVFHYEFEFIHLLLKAIMPLLLPLLLNSF